jgi:hypothetical protein
MKPDQTLV